VFGNRDETLALVFEIVLKRYDIKSTKFYDLLKLIRIKIYE